jgi:subtilisin family serine protease
MDAEASATWGLTRISHRKLGSAEYDYDSSAGAGACAYIIDTGVYAAHPELEGRAKLIKSYTGVNKDDNGHGTHVAGTIGSKTYGVAKKVNIYAIKVLDAGGSGAWSDIVDAIQYAVTDSKSRSCPNGIVVNMSLGGGKTQSVNDAVAAAVDAGLFFAVAAGNDGDDFSTTSPASEPKAFAVGASDNTDALASFSNYGKTLGVIAPGVDILSIWNDGKTVSSRCTLSQGITRSDLNNRTPSPAHPWPPHMLSALLLIYSAWAAKSHLQISRRRSKRWLRPDL